MRAGPLSNDRIISLLNSCFVPVYTSNEDYDQSGRASADEKKAYIRIYHEALRRKFHAGSVCVYTVAPDGEVLDAKAVPDTAKVLSMLEEATLKLRLKEGPTLVKPRPQSVPPRTAPDDLVIHVSAPYDLRRGSWHEFPAETWVVFKRGEWSKALTESGDMDREFTQKLLTYFYPATEDTRSNQIDRNDLQTTRLKGIVESSKNGRKRVRVEGALKMKRPFYPGHPEHKPVEIEASIVGYMDLGESDPPIVRLVTERATFNEWKFGVAARSVP